MWIQSLTWDRKAWRKIRNYLRKLFFIDKKMCFYRFALLLWILKQPRIFQAGHQDTNHRSAGNQLFSDSCNFSFCRDCELHHKLLWMETTFPITCSAWNCSMAVLPIFYVKSENFKLLLFLNNYFIKLTNNFTRSSENLVKLNSPSSITYSEMKQSEFFLNMHK